MVSTSTAAGARRQAPAGNLRWLATAVSLCLPLLLAVVVFETSGQARQAQTPGAAQVPARAADCRPGAGLLDADKPPEQRTRIYTVVAAPLRHEIRPGLTVPAWAYNGAVPAPEIRGVQGELLRVVLCNSLPAPVTIHWHGYPVHWLQDGVAGVTQNAVLPGEVYTYEFRLTTPGTYWYHSHQDSAAQVDRGLYGPFVVEPGAAGSAQAAAIERNVILADDSGNALYVGDEDVVGSSTQLRLAQESRSVWTLDGRAYPHVEPLRVRTGQTVLLRVLNAGLQTHRLELGGHLYRLVAVDGQPIHEPAPTGATLDVASGERYDLLFTADNPGDWSLYSVDPDPRAAHMRLPIAYEEAAGTPALADLTGIPQAGPLDLTAYGSAGGAGPDLSGVTFTRAYTVELTMDNGMWAAHLHDHANPADRRPPAATTVPTGTAGSMSGHDHIATTLRPGDLVKLAVVNTTQSEHPIHIHGHFFQLLSLDGRPYGGSPIWRDTATVWPRQTMIVGFKADNPGVWMIHCHILWHASMGMGVLFNYEGVESPYHRGGPHGNKPE